MKFRRVPGTDLELSAIGMGCWTISGKYWGTTDDAVSKRTVRAALDAGINWFDTAPLYGDGHADRLLAEALGDDLHRVILATKVGVKTGADGHAHSLLTPEHIVADCEASLRRLREPLDLLQVHWPCESGTPLDDSIAALEGLRERGWIRHWGLCNYDPESVRHAAGAGMSTLQTPYSMLRREFEGPLAPAAAGVAVLAYETLGRGLLSGKFTRLPTFPDTDQRQRDDRFKVGPYRHAAALTRDLGRVAAKLGVTTAAISAGWAASRPGITAAIVGARTPEQITETAQAASLIGQKKLWRIVEQIAEIHGPPPR